MDHNLLANIGLLLVSTVVVGGVFAFLFHALEKFAKHATHSSRKVPLKLIVVAITYGVLLTFATAGFLGVLFTVPLFGNIQDVYWAIAALVIGVVTAWHLIAMIGYIRNKYVIVGAVLDMDSGEVMPFGSVPMERISAGFQNAIKHVLGNRSAKESSRMIDAPRNTQAWDDE